MSEDESPVEKTASSGSPAESGASGSETPESGAKTRRRSPRPRTAPRAAKPAKVEPEVVAAPAPEPEVKPAAPKRAARPPRSPRTRAKAADTVVEPVVAPAHAPETPAAEEPASGPRRRARAPRKPAKAVEAEVTVEAVAPEAPAPVEDEAAPKRGSGRRTQRTPGRTAKPKPSEELVVEAVAQPEVEAQAAPDNLKPRRSRGGRKPKVATEEVVERAVEAVADAPAKEKPTRAPRARRGTPRVPVVKLEPPEDLTVGARVLMVNGLPELHINGVIHQPVFFFGNAEMAADQKVVESEIKKAASRGIHLHSTLIELTCPMPPDDSMYEKLDERIQQVLTADPDGYVLPRLVFVPAAGWKKQYPNEVNKYADGTTDDPSIASDHFWKEVETALTAITDRISKMTYGKRVIGYHLERGEWFHPKDGGYDRSFANREAFRQWLRDKYNNNESALRAAWYDGNVQFYTAEIPAALEAPKPEMTFFESRKERDRIDFLEYSSEVTARRISSLGEAIKKSTKNEALVSVCYGYTYEFGHTFSGHLALQMLLESKFVDIVSGPPCYADRLAGGAASIPGPVHSAALHGKLYLAEDDTKTYLAPGGDSADDFNPRIDSKFYTDQVQERALGRALAYQNGLAFMDTWGEGWLDSDEIWDRIGEFKKSLDEYHKDRKPFAPEIVVLIDEKSLLHVQRGPDYLKKLLQDQRDLLQRCGASVGFYLQSDVTAATFPKTAKLYIFLSPYRVTPDQRSAIKDNLQGDGRILVWLYAVGVCDSRGEPEDSVNDLVGIVLRRQSWNAEVGSKFLDTRHGITDRLRGKDLGTKGRLNPSYYVDDNAPGITTLAEYTATGLPSVALRSVDNWHSVFCGEPILTEEFLAGLCHFGKVHRYIGQADTYVTANGPWLTLVAPRDGQRQISLPKHSAVYDISEGKLITESAAEIRMFMRGRTTKRLFIGTLEEIQKYGFSTVRPAPEPERSPAPDDPVHRVEVAIVEDVAEIVEPASSQSEKEDQSHPRDPFLEFVDALGQVDEIPLYGSEVEGATPTEGDSSEVSEEELRRRRRRRGGRGRGRRRRVPGEAGGDTPTPTVE